MMATLASICVQRKALLLEMVTTNTHQLCTSTELYNLQVRSDCTVLDAGSSAIILKTLATITLHNVRFVLYVYNQMTYKAPRPNTPTTAIFCCWPICRDRMTGIGRNKTMISAQVFHAAWPYQKAAVPTQCPPGRVRFQKNATGVHWKIVTASNAIIAATIEALATWQVHINQVIGKSSKYKKTKDIFVVPTNVL